VRVTPVFAGQSSRTGHPFSAMNTGRFGDGVIQRSMYRVRRPQSAHRPLTCVNHCLTRVVFVEDFTKLAADDILRADTLPLTALQNAERYRTGGI
jgi:hypothetical protein